MTALSIRRIDMDGPGIGLLIFFVGVFALFGGVLGWAS
jgi:hypothetical protein